MLLDKIRFQMRRTMLVAIVLLLIFLASLTVFFYEAVMDIEMPFSPFVGTSTRADTPGKKEVVHVGVVSRYPPAVIYQGYQPIMDYLTQNSEYTFELRLSSSYHETVQQLVRGEVTAAFLGSVVYARERKNAGLQCILKPLSENGEAWSHTVLGARTESPIQNLADLRRKKSRFPRRILTPVSGFLRSCCQSMAFELKNWPRSTTSYTIRLLSIKSSAENMMPAL